MNNYNEKHLLQRLNKGSSEAFEELFHLYSGKLYNFVMKLSLGNTYMSEEMVQRTFIKVWETHSFINPDKSFISYLCTIAKNMLLNEYEHQTIEYIYREYILNFQPNKDDVTEKEVDRSLLEEYIDYLIEMLPPARKQVFILSRKEMLTNKEIAERLEISESTVQTQMSKAVSFMKEQLGKYYDGILYILLICYIVN